METIPTPYRMLVLSSRGITAKSWRRKLILGNYAEEPHDFHQTNFIFSMNIFFETWYCGLALWFWLLFLSGHTFMYIMASSLVYLQIYHPNDYLVASGLVAFISSFFFATCLPMFYVLTRYERKENKIAVKMLVICIVVYTLAFTACMLLIFYQNPNEDFYYKYLLRKIIEAFKDPTDDPLTQWFLNLQVDHYCCGLQGVDDYKIISNYTNTNNSSYYKDVCPEKEDRPPCMSTIMGHLNFITTTTYIITSAVMAGAFITAVFYAIGFVAIIEQPIMILTGRIYVRSSQEGVLKSFPEIDSEEAISVSSSD